MLRFEAWAIVVISYVVLVAAYLLPQGYRLLSPVSVWLAHAAFMVRTFQFHIGLTLTGLALMFAMARFWRLPLAVLPLVVFLMGPESVHYLPKPDRHIAGDPLRVMSVNLMLNNRTKAELVDEIKRSDPDVLLLQEYTVGWHEILHPEISATHPYVSRTERKHSFGSAIYSRKPFVGDVALNLPLGSSDGLQMRAVIEVSGRQLAIYNLHLLSPVSSHRITEGRAQFADLLEMLNDEPLPVVVGGDFNFGWHSPQNGELEQAGFLDAHDLAGHGRGATWPAISPLRFLPGLRLDHIYVGRGLTATASWTGKSQGSDHRPVLAVVGLELE